MGIFGNAFGWPHLIIILAVILLLFGATRLPALSRSLGQSIKIFRKEIVNDDKADAKAEATTESVADGSTAAAAKAPASTDKD